MEQRKQKPKKQNIVNSRPILMLLIGLGFLTLILLITMLAAGGDRKRPGSSSQNRYEADGVEETAGELPLKETGTEIVAVVKSMDMENKLITLYDVINRDNLLLSYTGGTNVLDKYDKIIAMSQIEQGSMVEAYYNKELNKLTDLKISTKAWEYIGVNNLSIDISSNIMKIASTKYKYFDDIAILDGEEFIPVTALAEQDELTIRGYEETIWSITVTRGHGSVKLKDYTPYLGANITIGYESMQQITDDMEIIVREGDFNLTVENGEYNATKAITVSRNQITFVSLADIGPLAPQKGRVYFEITPYGADLFVDGNLLSYANPVELTYGKHTLSASLGGYTSYEGTFIVDSTGKTIKMDLPEISTKTEPVAEETGADNGTITEYPDSQEEEVIQETEDEDLLIDEEHFIYVQNPIRASVYINGDFMCIAPGNFPKIIGTHVITFIEEGYKTKSYTIEISDDGLDNYLTFPDLEPEGD